MIARRRAVCRVGYCAVLGLLVGVLSATAGAAPVDVIQNGGFEIGTKGALDPDDWRATRVAVMKEHVAFTWDDEVSHTGRRSVSISVRESHPDDMIHYHWNQATMACRPGQRYDVTGWVKARNLSDSAALVVQCWDRQMTEMLGYFSTAENLEVTGTTDWVQIKTTVQIPDKTERVVILACIIGPANRGGTVWFDDIQITLSGSEEAAAPDVVDH